MQNTTRKFALVILAILVIAGGLIGIAYWQNHKNDKTDEASNATLSVTALNQTKNQSATAVTANPDDVVVFTLTAQNETDKVISGFVIQANIADVVSAATLTDAQGASYDSGNSSLVWTPLDIPANGTIQKSFTVKVNKIDATKAVLMKITYNNELQVFIADKPVTSGSTTTITPTPVPTPTEPYHAPVTGPVENYALWLAIITTIAYFGIRTYKSHKLGKN